MKKRQRYAIILSIVLIVSLIFSLGILIKDRDHNCHKEDCIICRRIHRAEKILSLTGTEVSTFHFRKILILPVMVLIFSVLNAFPKTSLIEKKVRLNI